MNLVTPTKCLIREPLQIYAKFCNVGRIKINSIYSVHICSVEFGAILQRRITKCTRCISTTIYELNHKIEVHYCVICIACTIIYIYIYIYIGLLLNV